MAKTYYHIPPEEGWEAQSYYVAEISEHKGNPVAISNELRKLVDPNNECCCEHCLSNKCKEWAYTNHEAVINIFQKTRYNPYTAKLEGKVFQLDTEPEAIFKACEYILKEHHAIN